MDRKLFVIIFVVFYILIPKNISSEEIVEPEIIKRNENKNYVLERIGNSLYAHYPNIFRGGGGEIVRYMDVTSLLSAEEFIRISDRIVSIGTKVMVQKPALDYYVYDHSSFGRIYTARELSPHWASPRYDITIDGYSFVYYPNGNNITIENYVLDPWNFNVPDYQENHVYVRIRYRNNTNYESDEEVFEISRIKVENLRELFRNILSSVLDENTFLIMNELANSLREKGHNAVVLERFECMENKILFANPGLAQGIFYLMVNGETVTTINSELLVRASSILDLRKPRMHYVTWTNLTGQGVTPIYYVQIFDEEVLLLEERYTGQDEI